ncbi:ankyrin [Dendrothele bispora CBS 962.96]|uniref:Ankyrin n=1 Tax=Dendrothele bispora (strain CBS 962.96) TaxID=1314807 RepID=A0A4S8MEL7_DENBC|nr:ankyrin [Dendrothele bispora CBS 962.96]
MPENSCLQCYAMTADDHGVASALESGADVNAADASGRTALMCAIAGEHWNDINISHASFMTEKRLRTIQRLLGCRDISLFTLNSPQSSFNDATPLGMAAWLNMPDAVRVLLEGSSDAVSVDGMDTHGATPLMYAARDGSLEVVKLLLHYGARPDFRDRNYRSTIQYALTHPQTLYLCEIALRQHRVRENETSPRTTITFQSHRDEPSSPLAAALPEFSPEATSRTTHIIIQLILSSDITSLQSFLSSSATSSASSQSQSHSPVLLNIPNAKGWSAIHYCAQMQFPSIQILDTLYCAGADISLFTAQEHWTVLHCLAVSYCPPDRTPATTDALSKFVTHLLFDLRAPFSAKDKEDETCIHLAAEHGQSLDLLKILLECDRSKSIQNIRNSRGLTAQEVARPEFLALFGIDLEKDRPESSLSMATIRPVTSSSSLSSSASSWKPSSIYSRREATSDDDSIVCPDDFDVVTAAHQLIDNLRITSPFIHHSIASSHLDHLESILRETEVLRSAIIQYFRSRAKGSSKALDDMKSDSNSVSHLLSDVTTSISTRLVEHGLPPIQPKRESEDSQATAVSVSVTSISSPPPSTPLPVDAKPKILPGTKSSKDDSKFSSKFMGWFKRKPSEHFKEDAKAKEMVVQETTPPSSHEMASPQLVPNPTVDKALQTSRVVLAAAMRDMSVINESLTSAKELMMSASRSIARADRIIKGAIKSRNTMLDDLRASGRKEVDELFVGGTPGALGYPNYLTQKPSIQSIDSVSSVGSTVSNLSFSVMIADSDDEEIKAIRRLVLRKIEARHDGALDEMDKVVGWLRVIKETVRGVKRRTYCK